MANMTTRYMGLALENPIIAGASTLTQNLDTIRKLEDSGAAAVVIASLFEEQIQLDSLKLTEDLAAYDDRHAEMTSIYPRIDHAGPDAHLMWVRRAKEAVDIPVIASLNAVTAETWVEWAQRLAETGVDGLELNFFALPKDFDVDSEQIENAQVEALKSVRAKVSLPISVKLSPFYTSPLRFIRRLDEIGVNGLVLFNRFFQPKIDVERERSDLSFNLSNDNDHRLALRFAGILSGKIDASICASNGVHTAHNVLEMLLAGADAVQVVSTLFRNSVAYLSTMLEEIQRWMESRGYTALADFRGKLSKANNPDGWAYTRGQYVMTLLRAKDYLKR
jgi:dihydroorotate dehydrogenase (fumarate)